MSPEFSFLGLVYSMVIGNVGITAHFCITSPCEQQYPLSFLFLALYILWLPEMWGVSHFWILCHPLSSNVP